MAFKKDLGAGKEAATKPPNPRPCKRGKGERDRSPEVFDQAAIIPCYGAKGVKVELLIFWGFAFSGAFQ